MNPVDFTARGAILNVLVQPRASRDEIGDIHDGMLRVRLRAPPVDNRANRALTDLLAERAGLRRGDVEVVSGGTGRRKRVCLRGADRARIRSAFPTLFASAGAPAEPVSRSPSAASHGRNSKTR